MPPSGDLPTPWCSLGAVSTRKPHFQGDSACGPRSVPWLLGGSVWAVLYLAGHGCGATRVTAAQEAAVPGQAWAPFQHRGQI